MHSMAAQFSGDKSQQISLWAPLIVVFLRGSGEGHYEDTARCGFLPSAALDTSR